MNRIVFVALTSITLAACADIDPNADGNTVADREAVSTPPPQFSRTYTVDFDYDPSGNAIAIGTAVNNVYAAWGVTFSASYCGNTATCNAASAYANSWGTSGNDVVSLFQRGYAAFDARWGTIEAHFSTPQTRVTIDAYDEVTSIGLTAPTARPWIEAYDASNNLVEQDLRHGESGNLANTHRDLADRDRSRALFERGRLTLRLLCLRQPNLHGTHYRFDALAVRHRPLRTKAQCSGGYRPKLFSTFGEIPRHHCDHRGVGCKNT